MDVYYTRYPGASGSLDPFYPGESKRKQSVTFKEEDMSFSHTDSHNVGGMERELKAALAKLYQSYDAATDEYDKLFDVAEEMREEYNNTKGILPYNRYHEYKRIIKNAIRKWRAVEKKNTLAFSRKQSSTSFANVIGGMMQRSKSSGSSSLQGFGASESANLSNNLNARLRADRDDLTRDLYTECTRLEREIFQYRAKNQKIKNLLCKLASDYDNSKEHVLHIWGRYKELKLMIKEVINSDV